MEETLEQSLDRIFGGRIAAAQAKAAAAPPEAAGAAKNTARQALDHFNRSQEYLRQGNWAAFGEELKTVERLLKEMESKK
jgi:uncharacterized membrane protein (UPF0182 family)